MVHGRIKAIKMKNIENMACFHLHFYFSKDYFQNLVPGWRAVPSTAGRWRQF